MSGEAHNFVNRSHTLGLRRRQALIAVFYSIFIYMSIHTEHPKHQNSNQKKSNTVDKHTYTYPYIHAHNPKNQKQKQKSFIIEVHGPSFVSSSLHCFIFPFLFYIFDIKIFSRPEGRTLSLFFSLSLSLSPSRIMVSNARIAGQSILATIQAVPGTHHGAIFEDGFNHPIPFPLDAALHFVEVVPTGIIQCCICHHDG